MKPYLWTLAALASITIGAAAPAPDTTLEDSSLVEGSLLLVRWDPRHGAPPGACDDLKAGDLDVSIGGLRADIRAIEHLPRPERHWLLIDTSQSTGARRNEAKHSAAQYVREVMTPGIDRASVITIADETGLAAGPSSDPPSLASRIESVPMGGASALRDGLDLVLRQIAGAQREQLVVYWTDGEDTASLSSLDDLLHTLDQAPHVTVFPVLVMSAHGLPSPDSSQFLAEVAQRSGGEIVLSSDSHWLDRIRGWIDRRFLIGLRVPDGAPKTRLTVTSSNPVCEATVLRDPFARPAAVAGSALDPPPSWIHRLAKDSKAHDPACRASESWSWPWRADGSTLSGCILDPSRLAGHFVARRAEVIAPAVNALPASFDDALDRLPLSREGPTPFLASGASLLIERARIAVSLFANRPDYRDFALTQLAKRAEDDIAAIARELHRSFPDLPPARLDEIARASRAGKRAQQSALAPTDADLADVLAAWISDVPSASLFQSWEQRLIDARIAAGHGDDSIQPGWSALRARFTGPRAGDVIAPLVLIKDAANDRIGFTRIVLPFEYRDAKSDDPEDRIPGHPLALLVVESILRRPDVATRLRADNFHAVEIAESPINPPPSASTDAFKKASVLVRLASRDGAKLLTLRATVRPGDADAPRVTKLTASIVGDDELAALIGSDE